MKRQNAEIRPDASLTQKLGIALTAAIFFGLTFWARRPEWGAWIRDVMLALHLLFVYAGIRRITTARADHRPNNSG